LSRASRKLDPLFRPDGLNHGQQGSRVAHGCCHAHRQRHPHFRSFSFTTMSVCHVGHLTNRWSQPLAVAMRTFDFMKQFSMFSTLAVASGGSALFR